MHTNEIIPDAINAQDETTPTHDTHISETEPVTPDTDTEPSEEAETEPSNPAATKARKDAAKYRERLRETETERDTLKSNLGNQLEALQRQIIDQHATAHGLKPAAFWAAGTALNTLINEDGTVNVDAVTASAISAQEILGLRRFPGSADQGAHLNQAPTPTPEWGGIFTQK